MTNNPIRSYFNINTNKRQICIDNNKKAGIYNKTGEIKLFTSIKQAAKFIGIQYSYITDCLKKINFV
jgi:molybdenum-dependent DNA-binding transcriptional regulator ModE